MLSMIGFRDGFLGVGVEPTGGLLRGVSWSSSDGVTWTRAGTIDDAASVHGVVVSTDGTLVAIGDDRNGAAVWTSKDASAWSRAELPSSASLGETRLDAISAGASGFLVLGRDTILNGLPPNAFFPPAPPMWHSNDGRDWTSVHLPDEGKREGIQVWSVAARPSGFIAGGAVLTGQRRFPAVWLSDDGLTWSKAVRLPDPGTGAAGKDFFINPLSAGPERMLAVSGRLNNEELGRIWSSPDGVNWERVTDFGSGEGELRVLRSTPGGFVGAFLVGDDPERQTLAVSTSADGAMWRQVFTFPEPAGQLPMSIAMDGLRVVILSAAQDVLIGPSPP